MSSVTRDVDVLKGKVLDQRINFDNMADRVIALEAVSYTHLTLPTKA